MGDIIDFLYLSPHLDDAVLSCGGSIHQRARRGERVVVLTVCAGMPPAGPLSPFAAALHARWGAAVEAAPAAAAEVVTLRRAEDAAALRQLGATGVHLDVPDCIYRRDAQTGRWLYDGEDAIFGSLDRHDRERAAVIAGQIAGVDGLSHAAAVYVPLAVGGHVDHQLVRLAAELGVGQEGELYFYEDFPYSEREGRLRQVLRPPEGWEPALVHLEEVDLAAKTKAAAEYVSQISTFWPDAAAMRQAMHDYAWRRGSFGALAERYWRPGTSVRMLYKPMHLC